MKHIVCFSGGHSSALVAIEVVRRYGAADVVLLNHDIHPRSEDADIKRFKAEVAAFLFRPVTYANHERWAEWDQFDVVRDAGAFKVGNGPELCTDRLKTAPFRKWLAENAPPGSCTIHYGFDANEKHRIQRRIGHLGALGYATDFPLALWPRTIQSTREVGIEPPQTYGTFLHANCIGCLKAGMRHWYIVYCQRPDIWGRAVEAEEDIGYSINSEAFLVELAPKFELMKRAGVEQSERAPQQTFWANARRLIGAVEQRAIPCDCHDGAQLDLGFENAP